MQGGVLELPLSLGQGMVPARLSDLCELRSKRVVYQRLVIVRAMRDVGRARAALVHQVFVKLGRNGAETFEMLRTAFVEQCLSRTRIFEWHKAETQLMTIRGLADRRQAKLTSVLRERERTDPSKSALNNP